MPSRRIIEILAERGLGRGAVNYRLRDWLLSRQRFWGAPIPIVYCEGCGEVAVPDDQLPVRLPDLRGQELAPKGASPLAAATDWVNTECPKCGGPAKRDTDTMDTFVDSSWYFLRYCSPSFEHGPFEVESVRRWSPVDLYVGGVEHAILHLLYSRFFVKVLHDMKMLDFTEPFTALVNQGQVINQGKAMSKSLGNGVDLGEQLAAHGVDAIRLTMIFASPPEDDIDWADMNPDALVRFLGRVVRVAAEVAAAAPGGVGPAGGVGPGGDLELRKATHRTIDDVTRLVESTRLNVAVARLMELVSAARRAIDSGPGAGDPAVREAAETLAVMLSLFAPYTAEECWEMLGHQPSVGRACLAGCRSRAAGAGHRDLRGPGRRQGAGPARSVPPPSARTSCASWPWPRRGRSARWRAAASGPSSSGRRSWSTSSRPRSRPLIRLILTSPGGVVLPAPARPAQSTRQAGR